MAPPRRRPLYPYIKLFSLPLHTLAPAHSVLVAAHGSILHRGNPELRGQGTVGIARVFRTVSVLNTVSRFFVPVRDKSAQMFLSRESQVPRVDLLDVVRYRYGTSTRTVP